MLKWNSFKSLVDADLKEGNHEMHLWKDGEKQHGAQREFLDIN